MLFCPASLHAIYSFFSPRQQNNKSKKSSPLPSRHHTDFAILFPQKCIRDISGPSLIDRGIQRSTGLYNILSGFYLLKISELTFLPHFAIFHYCVRIILEVSRGLQDHRPENRRSSTDLFRQFSVRQDSIPRDGPRRATGPPQISLKDY